MRRAIRKVQLLKKDKIEQFAAELQTQNFRVSNILLDPHKHT